MWLAGWRRNVSTSTIAKRNRGIEEDEDAAARRKQKKLLAEARSAGGSGGGSSKSANSEAVMRVQLIAKQKEIRECELLKIELDDRLRRNTKDDNPGMYYAIQNKKDEVLQQLRQAKAAQSSLEQKLRQGKTMGKALSGSKSMKSKIC